MIVRHMSLSDYPQLVELWEPEHMAADYDYLQAVLARNPTSCFVVEVNNRIVAAACGLYDGRRGILQSVAVLPSERDKGYGKAVVHACVAALRRLGTDRIRLFVRKENQQALPFYHKLGFEVHDDVIYMGLRV